jgi:hypothetical protein
MRYALTLAILFAIPALAGENACPDKETQAFIDAFEKGCREGCQDPEVTDKLDCRRSCVAKVAKLQKQKEEECAE